ncbi:MAG TPA: hypothetical protein VME01_02860 [Solirubrobacteraceae bacterium]|nr:hypothetical protein [Solirubrobacteraceae bacterium]
MFVGRAGGRLSGGEPGERALGRPGGRTPEQAGRGVRKLEQAGAR